MAKDGKYARGGISYSNLHPIGSSRFGIPDLRGRWTQEKKVIRFLMTDGRKRVLAPRLKPGCRHAPATHLSRLHSTLKDGTDQTSEVRKEYVPTRCLFRWSPTRILCRVISPGFFSSRPTRGQEHDSFRAVSEFRYRCSRLLSRPCRSYSNFNYVESSSAARTRPNASPRTLPGQQCVEPKAWFGSRSPFSFTVMTAGPKYNRPCKISSKKTLCLRVRTRCELTMRVHVPLINLASNTL